MFVSMLNGAIQDTDFEEEYDQIRNPNGGMGGWYGWMVWNILNI